MSSTPSARILSMGLRNETPVSFLWNDTSKGVRLSTANEPIGEETGMGVLISPSRPHRVIASAWRDQSLQLFGPVQHHVEPARAGLVLDHHEPLAVGGNIIVGHRDVLKNIPLFE
jgi:hypothetical protein